MSQTAPIGHNKPPEVDVDAILSRIREEHKAVLDRADKLNEASARIPKEISSEAQAQKIAEYIGQITLCAKRLEELRKDEKEVFLSTGKSVDDIFNSKKGMIDIAKAIANKPLTAYSLAKQKREQEEARKAKEKADAEAAALRKQEEDLRKKGLDEQAEATSKIAEKTEATAKRKDVQATTGAGLGMVKGTSASVSIRKTWVAKVVDKSKLDKVALFDYLTDTEIQRVLNAFVRDGGREMAGAEITEEASAVTR